MNSIDLSTYKLDEADGVFTYKNENTTLGFIRNRFAYKRA